MRPYFTLFLLALLIYNGIYSRTCRITIGITSGFDEEYDAYKLSGIMEVPQLYAQNGETKLRINVLSYTSYESVTPVCLNVGQDEEYTISVIQNTFWETVDISLKDLETNKTYKLLTNKSISINQSINSSPDRFLLLINWATGIEESQPEDDGIEIYCYGDKIFIKTDEPGEVKVSVYNLIGQKVNSSARAGLLSLNNRQTIELVLSGNTGFYLVAVKTNWGIKTKEVIVKRWILTFLLP